jgi:hypothetical protein
MISTAVAARQVHEAPGVSYTASPHAPGLRMFACTTYRATLSQTGCASRWRKAQLAARQAADAFATCRGCPIGAAHAGEAHVAYSKLYGVAICPRCRRGGARMIGGRLCISCYNRNRELAAGKNAKGNRPVELQARAPHPVEAIVTIDGEARRARVLATGLPELLLQTLRTTKGSITFAFAGPPIQRRDELGLSNAATAGLNEPSVDDCADHGDPAPAADATPGVAPVDPKVARRRQAALRYRATLFASAARQATGGQLGALAASRRAWRAWASGALPRTS